MSEVRKGFEWWDRFCKLQRYSFLLERGGIHRVADSCGNLVELQAAGVVVDDAQAEINAGLAREAALREELKVGRAQGRAEAMGLSDVYEKVLSALRDDDQIRDPGRVAKLVIGAIGVEGDKQNETTVDTATLIIRSVCDA